MTTGERLSTTYQGQIWAKILIYEADRNSNLKSSRNCVNYRRILRCNGREFTRSHKNIEFSQDKRAYSYPFSM